MRFAGLVVLVALLVWGAGCSRRPREGFTVEDRLEQVGDPARARLSPYFKEAGVNYPPGSLLFLGLKEEKRLVIYAAAKPGAEWRFVRSYPVLAASGQAGPKLREGDRQVPEGFYKVELLNPNSRFHLSLRIDYPNAEDTRRSAAMGFENPGSDIMIHGSAVSIGCLAVGDEAAEDFFVLAADTGIENIEILLVPRDLRMKKAPDVSEMPEGTAELYDRLRKAMEFLPAE